MLRNILSSNFHRAGLRRTARQLSSFRQPSASVPAADAKLFTPGPLTCSLQVKQAMSVDLGSRDSQFIQIIDNVRSGLLEVAGVTESDGWTCVPMQGSGSFAVESVIGLTPKRGEGKLLILSNGAYGERMAQMATYYDIDHTVIRCPDERSVPQVDLVLETLGKDSSITHVSMIHHETTSGALNPVDMISEKVKAKYPEITFIVDSMSGFGCFDVSTKHIDYLVSSSNKCIEGVPGFAYAICRKEKLLAAKGNARSLCLDLVAQYEGLEANKQFRFTPPTHALIAFDQALKEFKAEGGVEGRRARYQHNFEVLKKGFAEMGFHPYLDEDIQGCVITTFLFPDDPNFNFEFLYEQLQQRGIVIYPGKLTKADCFRIGSIGRLFERDMLMCLDAFKAIMEEMGVKLPVTQIKPE